jgi:hypothetical protein
MTTFEVVVESDGIKHKHQVETTGDLDEAKKLIEAHYRAQNKPYKILYVFNINKWLQEEKELQRRIYGAGTDRDGLD